MDLGTVRLAAKRAVWPWTTIQPLPTSPPSDHKSTDPQAQDLFDMGFKGETRALIFERIEPNSLLPSFMPFGRDKVKPPPRVQEGSMPTVRRAGE